MFIVGIDVAKRSHEVCMITSDGQTVQRPFSIRNNCTGYNLMLEKIRKHTNIKSQIVFAMESTAHYWLALFTRLRKDGYHVILLNPIQTSAMRDMFIRKIKTDAKDSFIIAELIRFGRYAESNVAQDRLLALKELCRNRFYLVDMAGDLKRKLIALIDRVFPEYEAQFDTIFCKSSVAVLKKYPTPQKLSNAHLDNGRAAAPENTEQKIAAQLIRAERMTLDGVFADQGNVTVDDLRVIVAEKRGAETDDHDQRKEDHADNRRMAAAHAPPCIRPERALLPADGGLCGVLMQAHAAASFFLSFLPPEV